MRVIIVGAGITGLTCARILAENGYTCEVYEQRDHIGGNCYELKVYGANVHRYGPHIFHTNDADAWSFVNQFSPFTTYVHKVSAKTTMGMIPIPFNLVSAEKLHLDPNGVHADFIVDLLFRDYSEKMWGCAFEDLPPAVTSRVPKIRLNTDCRYFTDEYQGIPTFGYNTLFMGMVDHPNIHLHLNMLPQSWRRELDYDFKVIIYTGSIDDYYGEPATLPYQTLDIVFHPLGHRLPAPVINYCIPMEEEAATRITDYRYFRDSRPPLETNEDSTVISKEYSRRCTGVGDVPYYPLPFNDAKELYAMYESRDPGFNVKFCGRLGCYQYLNMDQAVRQAMDVCADIIG